MEESFPVVHGVALRPVQPQLPLMDVLL
jgi:hypothetical protein